MKKNARTQVQPNRELESLRQQLVTKEAQLDALRHQVGHEQGQLGSMSGWTATDIKARLLEEAERARAEAEQARAEAEKHAVELEQAKWRLKATNRALERRTAQLETAAQVAREAAGILTVGKLLETTVTLIADRFQLCQAGVFLVDETGKYVVLQEASWEGGKQLLARGYKLLVGVQGLVGQVARTGEPRVLSGQEERQAGDVSATLDAFIPRSEAALPLKVRDRVIGVLNVRSTEPDAFDSEEIAILQTLADQVAVALDNARLFEQIKRHSQQLFTATEVSKSAMTLLDPEKLMRYAVKLIREGFDLHHVGIFLVEEGGANAVLRAGSAKIGDSLLPEGQRLSVGAQCIVSQCIAEVRALLVSGAAVQQEVCLDNLTLPETRSEMVLPLVTRGKAIGVLSIQSTQEAAFSEKDIPVFQTMVDQIAIALDNARLFKETTEAKMLAHQAQQAAEEINRAKSVFLANMSHELRTPLNAILGFTQLMARDQNLTADQCENLDIINRSGMHLLTLINDVLEMSKIEAGRTVLVEQNFDLQRMLGELETMFSLRAADKCLTLRFQCAADVPRYIRTDERKLRQVLINLLGNAVKFTKEGSVALRVARVAAANDTQVLRFQVEDTGPGIRAEDLQQIFNPFVQTPGGPEFTEGTGLGLPISREFVHLMGGEITVESHAGEGSCFTFEVRAGLVEIYEAGEEIAPREVLSLQPGQQAPDGGPYRLLVVEDREANRQLLVKLLTSLGAPPQGFVVREAVNGVEAVEIWETWRPHLVWMDMRMPVMDGYEATRRIKAAPGGQETIIIALTASAFEEDRVEMLDWGCDDFVRKPFRNAEVFDKLAQHLGVRYIYEELVEGAAPQSRLEIQAGLTSPALVALPAELLLQLEQAAVETDMRQLETVISAIHDHNQVLAEALASLASDFEYNKIVTAVQRARQGGSEA